MLAGAQKLRDWTCRPVRGRVLIMAERLTFEGRWVEIVTREGGRGKGK